MYSWGEGHRVLLGSVPAPLLPLRSSSSALSERLSSRLLSSVRSQIKLNSQLSGCAIFFSRQSNHVKLMWEYETVKSNVNRMVTYYACWRKSGKSGE